MAGGLYCKLIISRLFLPISLRPLFDNKLVGSCGFCEYISTILEKVLNIQKRVFVGKA